jgi:hypothetical protein
MCACLASDFGGGCGCGFGGDTQEFWLGCHRARAKALHASHHARRSRFVRFMATQGGGRERGSFDGRAPLGRFLAPSCVAQRSSAPASHASSRSWAPACREPRFSASKVRPRPRCKVRGLTACTRVCVLLLCVTKHLLFFTMCPTSCEDLQRWRGASESVARLSKRSVQPRALTRSSCWQTFERATGCC